jgi:cytoplasmic iron level regulating protein YaaA (DUF328/UPF0246 family)
MRNAQPTLLTNNEKGYNIKNMNTIILISCCSKKLNGRFKAEKLYDSTLFKLSLAYARKINHNKIFILSAKYGLLKLTDEIEKYDLTLNNMTIEQIKEWSENVLKQLKALTNIKNDKYIFLTGKNYSKYIFPELVNKESPMDGLPIGKRLRWLKEKLNGK